MAKAWKGMIPKGLDIFHLNDFLKMLVFLAVIIFHFIFE